VVAISDGTGEAGIKARILLDGKPMDNMKGLWAITRPSLALASWMPAINNIGFEQPLLEEKWTLTCLSDSEPDGKKIHFTVKGSVTGEDGEGWSTRRFVSNSGRVIIEPSVWYSIPIVLNYRKMKLPENYQVTWKAYPLFACIYEPQAAGTRTLLIQGCANVKHTLTLVPKENGVLGIGKFVVYSPPLTVVKQL
jgi:hypothetical protein